METDQSGLGVLPQLVLLRALRYISAGFECASFSAVEVRTRV